MHRDHCLVNPENRHDHRCPYYDHDVFSCDKTECPSHHPEPWADDDDDESAATERHRMTTDMTHIDEILDPALLAAMVAERYVNRQYHPFLPLTVWNYGQKAQFDNVWNPATLTCRGLITNSDGYVIARPFRKFFNLSQLAAIPDGPFVAHAKMDGSLGIIYPHPSGPAVATRGSFTSDQAIWATAWLRSHPEFVKSAEWAFDQYVTLLVEIIYPGNRIVVNYGDRAELVLLAAIDNVSGDDCRLLEAHWPGAIAERHDGLDLESVMALNAPNTEGFVLQWGDGTRAKVKFAEYLRLHKILTGVNARTIWEMLSNGQPLDDLFEMVPDEFHQWARGIIDGLDDQFIKIQSGASAALAMVPRDFGRREQAEIIKRAEHPGIVFAMLDDKPHAHMIWRLIKPKASTPFAQDDEAA